MTTFWNLTTKQELVEVSAQMKAVGQRMADAVPASAPAGTTTDFQARVYSDMLACVSRIATLVKAYDELLGMLPDHDAVRKARS